MKPISKTAFYCAVLRMRDANASRPVCNDGYARLFVDDFALQVFERFKHLAGPNMSTLYRHKIIDDHLRDILKEHPDSRIFIIGAGFDTRAYRLPGGIWTEFDQPELMEYKNQRLPVSQCKNRLARVPITFAEESLQEKLSPFRTDERVIVIVEGVFLYLDKAAMENVIRSLTAVFPKHLLFCELMSTAFFYKYSQPVHEVVKSMGTGFQYTVDEQQDLFYNAGYRCNRKISILKTAAGNGDTLFPRFMLPFLRTAVNGLAIYAFEFGASPVERKG